MNLVPRSLRREKQKRLPHLASTLSLAFPSLILPAFVLTNMAALVQFNRLDVVPTFRQIFSGAPIAKRPAALRISHSFSHFRVAFVRTGFGPAIAPWVIGNCLSKCRGDTESWKRLSQQTSKKIRITR
jgi:hypothetical protein